MADHLVLTKQPPPIALLNDGIRYEVESLFDFSGIKAELILDMSLTQANYLGNLFALSFRGMDIEFIFATDPDTSGTQLTSWDFADTYEVFVNQLCNELNSNFYINEHFTVSPIIIAPTNRVIFQAKEIGIDNNITLLETTIDGLLINTVTDGAESNIPADYKIYFAPFLYVADPLPTNSLGSELLSIDVAQKSYVDLSEYIDDEIKTQFTYPFNGVIAKILPNAVGKVFIQYSDFYDNQVQKLRSSFDTPIHVVRGGLNTVDSNLLNGDAYNYFDYADNVKRFLNHAPVNKITYSGVPELLYFLITTTGISKVMLKVTKFDETTETTIVQELAYSNQYKIVELSVGVDDLLLGVDTSDILFYEIWIEDDKAEALSETRTFTLDHNEYNYKRVIFFQNSFDLYETVCCTGELNVKDDFTRTTIYVSKNMVFRKELSNVKRDPTYTLNTGWLPNKEYREWLNEILLSKDTFYMLGHILLPVVITNDKPVIYKDREFLYSLSISFKPDFSESRFSSIVGDGVYFLLNEDGVVLLNENDIGFIASI